MKAKLPKPVAKGSTVTPPAPAKKAPTTGKLKESAGKTKPTAKTAKGSGSVTKQAKATAKSAARAVAVESQELRLQSERFTKAMEAFHARDLKKARDLFGQAADGPNREMSYVARDHQRMCEQRLERLSIKLDSPEDYYASGVAFTTQGKLPEAKKALEQAIKLRNADHYHYALALCLGLMGDIGGSAHELRTAIEMEPANRLAARRDPDFAELLPHAAIRALVFSTPA